MLVAWTRQWQEMGRGECLKGTGAEQTGLAVGLDVGLRERGPILGLAASLPIPQLQECDYQRAWASWMLESGTTLRASFWAFQTVGLYPDSLRRRIRRPGR